MSEYQDYPEADAARGGCKVGWRLYKNRADAEAAAAAAKWNAKIDAALGFDFGYQAPGSIELVKSGDHQGLWEVCIP